MTAQELVYGLHLDGGQQVEGLTLPTYASAERASLAASLLKRAEPEALVSIVVWGDDDGLPVARTFSEATAADAVVAEIAETLIGARMIEAARKRQMSTVPDEPFGYDPAG